MLDQALIAGLVLAVCFPIGALLALNLNLRHSTIATVMALGSGLLIAALSLDLISEALDGLRLGEALGMMILAAVAFSGTNAWLASHGAKHRNRCGGCVEQPSEDDHSGSGRAIALGTVMDAFPEAIVVGVVAAAGGELAALVAAIAIGNVAQALSSSSGLADAGRSRRFIFGLWFAVAAIVVLLAVGSAALLGTTGGGTRAWIEAFAAGILIAMVAEAMLPEAVHAAPRFCGIYTAIGFAGFVALSVLL